MSVRPNDASAPPGVHPSVQRLQGSLGVTSITMMVVATAAPLGAIAAASPVAIGFGNGAGAAGDFVVVGLCMLLFSVALSAMSRYINNSGAFYSYIGHGLGPAIGMAAAAVSWLTYTAIEVATCAYVGVQIAALADGYLALTVPWWVCSLAIIVIVGILGFNRIELAAKVLGVVLGLEVLIITVTTVAVLVRGGAEGINFRGFAPSAMIADPSGFAIGAMFCATAFIGFEATAVYREEARDPDRTVPRATYIAVGFIGLFYAFATWGLSLAWPADELVAVGRQGAPFLTDAASTYVAPVLSTIIQFLLVTSLIACLLSLHNVLARYQHVLGRSKVLPAALGRVHLRHGSPHVASLVTTATLTVVLAACTALGLDPIANTFAWFAGLSSIGFSLLLALTCLSTLVFFVRTKADTRPWHTRLAPGLGLVGLTALLTISVVNFPALVGGDGAAYTLLLALPCVAATGLVATIVVKRRHPHRYAAICTLTQSND